MSHEYEYQGDEVCDTPKEYSVSQSALWLGEE